ncbi:MAG: dihydrodipicolinate synthase family protein [Gemmatimonadetes bacterium]|jgi:4-hydroxy-tetrahydrodipicolinate synthase|nr:dihydrodipicolinate synthase family protein [Gemmatimonadota bacterium]MBT7863201.1 dihydrodipicolinate synthase family protein [Gemmatimonadota bacterium]
MTADLSRFRGIFPAVVTPMTAQDDLHEDHLRAVFDLNVKAGAHGFWIAGGSGESVLLSDDENRRIATVAAQQVGDRAVTIMHVGAPTTTRAADLAAHAAAAGVHAICCVPPFFYRRSDEEIVEHYRAVGAAADLPLFVYNLPGSTGVEITVDLLRKIQDGVPQLAGLKHSSMNLVAARQFADMGLSCFTGSSQLLLPAMTMGACGCVDGPPCVAPEPWVAMWNALEAGDSAAAEVARRRSVEVIDLCVMFTGTKFHAVMKAAVGLRLGLNLGDPRRPALPLTEAERAQVAERLAALGLDTLG